MAALQASDDPTAKVFIVYHPSKQAWLENCLLVILEGQSIDTNLLHTDRIPGENIFNAILRALKNTTVRILAIFSPDFKSCKYCAFFLEKLPEYSSEGKIIPICTEECKPPECISNISYLTESSRNFSKRLIQALNGNTYGSVEQFNPPTCEHVPRLLVKEKPAGKVKALPEYKRKRFRQSLPDKVYDHKLVLSQDLRFLKSLTLDALQADISFDIEAGEVCMYSLQDEEKVKILNESQHIKVRPAQQPGKVSATEVTYFVRIRHPSDVQSVAVNIRFDLKEINNRNRSSDIVDSCWVSLVSKDNVKTKPRNVESQKSKVHAQSDSHLYDAESESESQTQRVSHNGPNEGDHLERPKSYVQDILVKNEDRSVDDLQKVCIHLKSPQRGIQSNGILLKRSCRELMFYLDKLSENSKDDYEKMSMETTMMLDYYKQTENWDYQMLIYTKLIGAAHYRNDLRNAKVYMKALDSILPECRTNRSLMTGKALIYKTAIYRERSKFAKAESAVIQAINALRDVEPGEDIATAHFNYGKYFMKIMETIHSVNTSELQTKALEHFNLAMDYYMKVPDIDFKQVRRCLLNMARVCVNCPLMRVKQYGLAHDEHKIRQDFLLKGVTLNDRNTEQAWIYIEKLRGYSAMGDLSDRNLMQTLYTEAEIKFIQALCALQEDQDRNDEFYKLIGGSISKLDQACRIATAGGYKESASTSKFLNMLQQLYSKFKRRFFPYPPVETQADEDSSEGGKKSSGDKTILVYSSGIENLSSSASCHSTDSDNECYR